jgi:hypothetical protein
LSFQLLLLYSVGKHKISWSCLFSNALSSSYDYLASNWRMIFSYELEQMWKE